MLKINSGEKFKEISFAKNALRLRYAISSHGRLISFKKNSKDGTLLRGTKVGGYVTLKVRPKGVDTTIYIHKLAAQHFAKKSSAKHNNVIHLNHNKGDNRASNLKWVTTADMIKHHRLSPAIKKYMSRIDLGAKSKTHKLNAVRVKEIKRMLNDKKKNYTLRKIATKFRISDMQVYRIKSGANWSQVKV